MTPRHTSLLLPALLLWLGIAPALMAQEERSVLLPDSIEVTRRDWKSDTLVVDTTALHAIGDNLLKAIRPRRDLSTFKPW